MTASAHYESIKPYLRKPPFCSQPDKSHIYLSDTSAKNATPVPYVFGNSLEFERHIADNPKPSTRVVYVTVRLLSTASRLFLAAPYFPRLP